MTKKNLAGKIARVMMGIAILDHKKLCVALGALEAATQDWELNHRHRSDLIADARKALREFNVSREVEFTSAAALAIEEEAARLMVNAKLEVENVIVYSPEHATRHCDILLHGLHDDCGVKRGDFVTLTKVEPEAKSIDEFVRRSDQLPADAFHLAEARRQAKAMDAIREAVDPEKTEKPITEKTIKVDRGGSALESLLVNKGDTVLISIAHRIRDIP